MRPSGLDVLGQVPWGTHFCQFYRTAQDLLDVLVPYFRAGLENNEFCMWVVSEPVSKDQARAALRTAVPDLDDRIRRGQIEFLNYDEWYTLDGVFDSDRTLRGWADKLEGALARGFDGLRLTGNTFWLEKGDWEGFTAYEAAVDNVLHQYRMLALCTYSLEKCGIVEVMDVVSNHQFALIRDGGTWRTIHSAQRLAAEQRLAVVNAELEQRVAELAAANESAEAANRAKDKFLAVLSHELRTPLTPALMTASAMEFDDTLPDGVRENAAIIKRSLELQVRLIDDLLDVNRVAHGKLELNPETFDIHSKLQSAVEICRSDVHQKRLSISLTLSASEHHVRGDAGRLQQVFWNLLKNAVKFTPKGGRIEVRSCNPQQGTVRVEISDTGIGIPSELLPRLFDAFEQGSPYITREFGGLGLGLAISKALVELHLGVIQVSSDGPGKGATFSVELPTVPAPTTVSSRSRASGQQPDRKLRILVVEDNDTTANVLARLLSRAGHEVKTAGSVRQAVEIGRSRPVDLLVSDLGLPDGSGLDLIRELRVAHPPLKGIALSGYGMEKDIQSSKAAGYTEHLIKPLDFATLQAAITRVSVSS